MTASSTPAPSPLAPHTAVSLPSPSPQGASTPLHLACSSPHHTLYAAKMLLLNGADAFAKDKVSAARSCIAADTPRRLQACSCTCHALSHRYGNTPAFPL